jgi:aromatic-L-amino-acid decarboxylase
MEVIFADFERLILPGMTNWQHPRFFAYFPGNSSPPSVIAEHLTSAIGAQCMLWQTSPAATELEQRMMDWLRQMIGLPADFTGVIQDSASTATLAALLTARERALGFVGNNKGLSGSAILRVYCSEQCHSSVDKACRIAGIGQNNLVKITSGGPLYGIDIHALEASIVADKSKGHLPAAIVACVGGTSIGGTDDVAATCAVARRHGLYVHVDAAWAGSAMICPEFRSLMAGSDGADSFVFNPHKWLLTNFDCSAHFVRDPEALVRTLGIRPAYLETHGRDGIVNFSEWSVPLGRRFRALKLWFVIRSYGVERLQHIIRGHVAWSRELAEKISSEPGFEIVTPPILSLFTFRYSPPGATDLDGLNRRLLEAINDDGRIYLTQTTHAGRYVIRFQAGQTDATREDVLTAFDVIREIARGLKAA